MQNLNGDITTLIPIHTGMYKQKCDNSNQVLITKSNISFIGVCPCRCLQGMNKKEATEVVMKILQFRDHHNLKGGGRKFERLSMRARTALGKIYALSIHLR